MLLLTTALVLLPVPTARADSFTVNTAGDMSDVNPGDGVCADVNGNCSLRAAIEETNALAGADSISFNIRGSGVHTITLGSALPSVTEPLTLDGSTQPGFAGTPLIVVDADGIVGTILTVSVGDTTLRDLGIANAVGTALHLNGSDNVTVDGLDLRWTQSDGQMGYGIQVDGTPDGVTIQDIRATHRNYGVRVNTGSDVQVLNSDLSDNNYALYLNNVQSTTLPGGVNIAGNSYAGSSYGVYFLTMSNLVISDGSVGGTNVNLAGGALTRTVQYALYLNGVDDTTIENLDFSWNGDAVQRGYGIYSTNSDNLLIQHITATNRAMA